jgi:hypothetical protein
MRRDGAYAALAAVATPGTRATFRLHVTVRLRRSPSLGCEPMYRVPLPDR